MSADISRSIGHSVPRWALLLWIVLVGGRAEAVTEEVVIDPPGRVARLSHTDGEVIIAPAGTEEWAESILNRPLTSGDRLWTESGARAELQIGSAAVYLDERTSFGFIELDDDVIHMSLTQGSATFRVRRLSESESVQIETPNVAVALREPGEYHIEVDAQTDQTIVKTRHGVADVFGDGTTHIVRANVRGIFTGLEPLSVRTEPLAPRTAFESWANERERRESESRSAEYVSRDVVGYEDLDEHGDWVHEPDFGYAWRPRTVAYDWVPYRDGRWIWVAPWGWTWVDHSPWGFAPFHYGRWALVRERWCWVPGPRHYRPIYAPALVGWIGRPHIGVSLSFGSGIGWFPLGPREIYVPWYRHSPRYIRHVNASNTIIVNNTYIRNVYSGRYRDFEYRYRAHPRAITATAPDHFIGGRPVLGRIMRVDAHDLGRWQLSHRPPSLTPDRASLLAGSARTPPLLRGAHNRLTPRRSFDAERQRIETDSGRTIGRTHPHRTRPKDVGDFNPRGQNLRLRARDDAIGRSASRPERIEPMPVRSNVQRPSSSVATRDVLERGRRRDHMLRERGLGEPPRSHVRVERPHTSERRRANPTNPTLHAQREHNPPAPTAPDTRNRIGTSRNTSSIAAPRSIDSGRSTLTPHASSPSRGESRVRPSAPSNRTSSPSRAHAPPRASGRPSSMTHGGFRHR
ncbi:MAG: hypothetical protein C0P74_010295 [Gammaproteobacteria bacterium]